MFQFKLPRERKERMIESVQAYYSRERGEEIGSVAAELLLDFFIAEAGPVIYNQALTDARKLLVERMAAMEDELFAIEVPDQPGGQRARK